MEPHSDALPFLVVHGGWFWIVLVVAAGGLGLGLRLARRAWQARRVAHRACAALAAAATTTLTDQPAVVRGILHAEGAEGGIAAATIELSDAPPPRPPHLTAVRAPVLWLDCSGERVELIGDVTVAHGTVTRSSWRRFPRRTPGPLADVTRAAHGSLQRRWWGEKGGIGARLSTLAPGDEVAVDGVLAHRADGGDLTGGYRDGAGGWTLTATAGQPLALHALRPATAAPALGVARAVVTVALAGAAMFTSIHCTGKYAKDALKERDVSSVRGPMVLGRFDLGALAALSPFHRTLGLRYLENDLSGHSYRDEAAVRRLVALAELRLGCAGAIGVLFAHERWDEARARAVACHRRRAELDALVALGRFDEAAVLLPDVEIDWVHREGQIWIAAGRWQQASAAALAMAADDAAAEGRWARARQHRYGCLAELFQHHAGDTLAATRLREHAAQPGAEQCVAMAALTLPDAERTAYLVEQRARVDDDDGYEAAHAVERALWMERGPRRRFDEPRLHDAVRGLIGDSRDAVRTWLAPDVVAALRGPEVDPMALAEALAWAANQAVLRGDLAAARAAAREVATLVPEPLRPYQSDEALKLVAGVELHTTTTELELPPAERYAESLYVRRGDAVDLDNAVYGNPACDVERHAAILAAQRGDGVALARVIQGCGFYWIGSTAQTLLAVVPRVQHGRAELATALTYFRDNLPDDPFERVAYAAMRRDLLRLAGADVEAARWAVIVDRHAAVLTDRDRLLALAFWHQ